MSLALNMLLVYQSNKWYAFIYLVEIQPSFGKVDFTVSD